MVEKFSEHYHFGNITNCQFWKPLLLCLIVKIASKILLCDLNIFSGEERPGPKYKPSHVDCPTSPEYTCRAQCKPVYPDVLQYPENGEPTIILPICWILIVPLIVYECTLDIIFVIVQLRQSPPELGVTSMTENLLTMTTLPIQLPFH